MSIEDSEILAEPQPKVVGKNIGGAVYRPVAQNLVPLARFERTTFRLGGGCSILLSYRGLV